MLYVFFFFFFSFPLSLSYVFLLVSRVFLLYLCPNHAHAHRHTGTSTFSTKRLAFFPFISKLFPGIVVAKRVQEIKYCQFLLTNFQENGGWRKGEESNIKGKKRKEEKKEREQEMNTHKLHDGSLLRRVQCRNLHRREL